MLQCTFLFWSRTQASIGSKFKRAELVLEKPFPTLLVYIGGSLRFVFPCSHQSRTHMLLKFVFKDQAFPLRSTLWPIPSIMDVFEMYADRYSYIWITNTLVHSPIRFILAAVFSPVHAVDTRIADGSHSCSFLGSGGIKEISEMGYQPRQAKTWLHLGEKAQVLA